MFGARDVSELTQSCARRWRESPGTFRRILETRFRGEQTFQEETKVVTLDGRVIDVLMTTARRELINDPGISIVGFIDISVRLQAGRRGRRRNRLRWRCNGCTRTTMPWSSRSTSAPPAPSRISISSIAC